MSSTKVFIFSTERSFALFVRLTSVCFFAIANGDLFPNFFITFHKEFVLKKHFMVLLNVNILTFSQYISYICGPSFYFPGKLIYLVSMPHHLIRPRKDLDISQLFLDCLKRTL